MSLLFIELIETQQCPGQESEVEERISSLEEQWTVLVAKSAEKTQKLKEANQVQQFNEEIKGNNCIDEDIIH